MKMLTLIIASIIIEFIITTLYKLLFKIDKKVRIPAPISTTLFLISILSAIDKKLSNIIDKLDD